MSGNTARTTKKILLSIGVLATFAAYTFVLRNQQSSPVIAPALAKKPSNPSTSQTNNTGNGQPTNAAGYKTGTYTGSVANAFYGNVQVQVTVSSGKITDVQFLQYPNDSPNSQSINRQATPDLRQEAIQAQSAQVDIVTGATDTSQAFVQSLSAALAKAQA